MGDEWTEYAACQPTVFGSVTYLFYSDKATDRIAALRYCDQCPVRLKCRERAFANQDWHGVQGGMEGEERLAQWQTLKMP